LLTHAVFGARLSNQWLSADMCVKAIKLFGYLSIDIAKMLDVPTFNRAMSKSPVWGQLMEFYNGTNITGVWRVTYDRESFYRFIFQTNLANKFSIQQILGEYGLKEYMTEKLIFCNVHVP